MGGQASSREVRNLDLTRNLENYLCCKPTLKENSHPTAGTDKAARTVAKLRSNFSTVTVGERLI